MQQHSEGGSEEYTAPVMVSWQLARERGRVNLAYLGISSTFSGVSISTPLMLAYPKFVLECRFRA